MNLTADQIVGMVLFSLPNGSVPTEELIREAVDRITLAFHVDAPTKQAVLRQVMARRLIKMDTGYRRSGHSRVTRIHE